MAANTNQRARIVSIPAPVRGLNLRNSPAQLAPQDALVLENVVCRPTFVEVRKGRQDHKTGFGSNIETLMTYLGTSGSAKLFAATSSAIYDATIAGAVGAAVVSSLTSGQWSYTQVTNVAGHFLLAVNGADAGQKYDGTSWAAMSITGVATTALDYITVWKRRVWAVEKNTLNAWYLATDAISGAATRFDFSAIFRRGGKLVALINWTMDAGSGVDDHLLAVTSAGELAVYQGTDPASASTFALKGVYDIGAPVGRRFFSQLGGDVVMLTSVGLVSVSSLLQSSNLSRTPVISDSIGDQLRSDVRTFGSQSGWEVLTFIEENLLLVQVPSGSVGSRSQWVMNTMTKAWSHLSISPAITFTTFNGSLYCGQSDRVSNCWTGGLDGTTGITYRIIPAFSYFGSPGQLKKFGLARAHIRADSSPVYAVKLLRDFDTSVQFPSQVPSSPSGSAWGIAHWGVDVWGGSATFYRRWSSVTGAGLTAALAIEGIHSGATWQLYASDYSFEMGGPA